MLKRVGESRHPRRTPNCCSEPVFYASVEEGRTGGLVTEIFDDSDKVGTDVVLLLGCSQSCMPNPVGGLLEAYEDTAEVLLVLDILLTKILRLKICSVVLLPALIPTCSLAMIFSACGFRLFSMIFSMTLLR